MLSVSSGLGDIPIGAYTPSMFGPEAESVDMFMTSMNLFSFRVWANHCVAGSAFAVIEMLSTPPIILVNMGLIKGCLNGIRLVIAAPSPRNILMSLDSPHLLSVA